MNYDKKVLSINIMRLIIDMHYLQLNRMRLIVYN